MVSVAKKEIILVGCTPDRLGGSAGQDIFLLVVTSPQKEKRNEDEVAGVGRLREFYASI